MPLRSLRCGVIDHTPWFVSIWLVDSERRMDKSRTLLAANSHCRVELTDNAHLSAVIRRAGVRQSPRALRGWVDLAASIELSW
jgi:hypothetical protein